MDSLFQWFQKHLGSKEKYFIETDSLDLDDLSRYLKVESNGEHNGKNNYPASTAKKPDAFEGKIISFFNKRLSKLNERANNELSKLNTSIAYPSINDLKKQLEAMSNNVYKNVEHSTRIRLNELKNEKKHLENAESDYSSFREKFDLVRLPHYPDSKFFVIALVIAFWLAETIMNGFFFAKGSDLGLIGGWFEAGAVSFINIFFAFLVGIFARQVNHPSTGRKIIAWSTIAGYALFSFVFNLFVGHYRDMIGVNTANVAESILPRVLESPFGINDVFSWLLVMGGMFFALLALIDGYKSDDPFPGYGKQDRKLRNDRDTYQEVLEESVEEIESERELAISQLESLKKSVKSEMTNLAHIRDLKATANTRYLQQIEATIGQANTVLKKYRQHNIMSRSEEQPAYFDKEWKPTIELKLHDQHNIDQAEIDELRATAPVLINTSISEIRDAFNGYLERIHEIEPGFKVPPEDNR
jgi:hypothetical protein